MTYRDVPRTLFEKHASHDLAAIARAAIVDRAVRRGVQPEEKVDPKTLKPQALEQRVDERKPPEEEVLKLEAALAGELAPWLTWQVLERMRERSAA